MESQELIKRFEFIERERANLVFSDAAKINLDSYVLDQAVKLKADSNGYPTTGEHYVKHVLTEPRALENWLRFDYEADEPSGTEVLFRLSDGAQDYYFDGANWSVATSESHWNTAAEIDNAISTFRAAVGSNKLQPIARLKTSDPALTPKLRAVKILMGARFGIREEVILRSFIPALKANLRPQKDTSFILKADLNMIQLGDGSPYTVRPAKVADVYGVWNHTDDPDHLQNLKQSFDPNTETLTASGDRKAPGLLRAGTLAVCGDRNNAFRAWWRGQGAR